jgi:DNA adenine methylase
MTVAALKAPFPYFGGKSLAASLVWERFGDVPNYVEPFAGSLAVLLGRPHAPRVETVNDLDGFIANFWRATIANPEAVARYANWPVNENDLHARHSWLVNQRDDMTRKLEGDPDWHDPKIAGWWCWGLCGWIGNGWCTGKGPWRVTDADGTRQLLKSDAAGRGVYRKLPHIKTGQGVNRLTVSLIEWFDQLRTRLARVRVCCGDWSRVCGPSPTTKQCGNLTGVFLDPPYADTAGRDDQLYACDSLTVAHAVRDWAISHGDDPRLRIAICGYDGEHTMPDSWACVPWKAAGGYGSQSLKHDNPNARRERIWFSPHCLTPGVAIPTKSRKQPIGLFT